MRKPERWGFSTRVLRHEHPLGGAEFPHGFIELRDVPVQFLAGQGFHDMIAPSGSNCS